MRIGVFGHYGNGNLGDEAITEATIDSARRIANATEIRLYSIVPADSAARHRLDAYPIRRGPTPVTASESPGLASVPRATTASRKVDSAATADESALRRYLKRSALIRQTVSKVRNVVSAPGRFIGECAFLVQSFATLRDLDLMIVAGSNQYLDNFGGVMGFPYTLLKWAILCRLRRVKVVFMSIGAGPLEHRISKMMVRRAIGLGHFHSYRDEASLRLIEGQSSATRSQDSVYPDLACNLNFPQADVDYTIETPTVAINPMPVYGDYWFIKDPDKYRKYLTVLAELIVQLDNRGCQVVLFPTQFRDMDAIHDLVKILGETEPSLVSKLRIEDAQESQDVMRIIQSAHVVIPTRFHGAVLSVLAKRLVIGVCYQAKAAAVLTAAGQQDYAFMLDDMNTQDLIDAFDRLWQKRSSALEAISQQSDSIRDQIDSQYKRVLASLDA